MSNPITPGAYLKHRRCAAGLSVLDVAAQLATEPRLAEHARAEWLERIEADVVPATFATIAVLRAVYPFDLDVLAQLARIQLGAEEPAPDLCRICGCSWNDPCTALGGGCHWHDAAHTICSSCVSLPERAA